MTFAELEKNIRDLKFNDNYCNLLKRRQISETGLYVNQNKNIWEVYNTGRSSAELLGIFYSKHILYEFIYCYFKKISDENCWLGGLMWIYPQDLIKTIKKFKIPELEYSFDGGMQKDCLSVEQIEIVDNGEISHHVLKSEDGSTIFNICRDRFEPNGGKADAWNVYYTADGKEKVSYGAFFRQTDAYDFLFYLVMRNHVDIKKRWW